MGPGPAALSCDDWLAVIEPHLTPPLFDTLALRRLRDLAPNLPGDCLAAIEVRLGSAGPVDLSLQLLTPAAARRMAGGALAPHLQRFLALWAGSGAGGGAACPAVCCLWLEFDLDGAPAALPQPSLCARLAGDVEPVWLLDVLLPAMHGKPLGLAQRRLVSMCHASIPRSASLLYVFSLLPRRNNAVRLQVSGLSSTEILEYLRCVVPRALPGVAAAAPIFTGVERLHLSLDITEQVLTRIGLEASFSRQPAREPRWRALFAGLEARGLCSPARRDAVLAWTGCNTFWSAPTAWPIGALGAGGRCVRSLSHVKVVCYPEREPEAKAYLLFGPLHLDRGRGGPSAALSLLL